MMRNARALFLAWLVGSAMLLSSCDKGRAVRVTSCALTDGKLSAAFRSPAKAKAYLTRLAERLKAGERQAIDDAAELIERVNACLD